MSNEKTFSHTLVVATLCWLLSGVPALAQQPAPPATSETARAAAPSTQTSATSQPLADETQTRPLFGVQGVLVETLSGRNIAAQNTEQAFNPASAVKLATALIALRTFGPQHRFATAVWTDGTLDRATSTIKGNLYVSGRDPSLHYEQAVEIAQKLNALGIRTVTGNLVVAQGFTLNFNWSALKSGEQFYDTLDAQLRSSEADRAWLVARIALGDKNPIITRPSVAVMGAVLVDSVVPGAKLLLTHNSSKLTDVLKVLLCYSNNFMAERLGEGLGGVESVERQLEASLQIPADQIRLASLSGLGVNRVTPEAMMKILRALREEMQKSRLSLSDIMPVAGVDPGTLEDRFAGLPWRGSVIAKTGTLVRTDGGASALVGQMRTTSGEILLFVIMNQNGSVLRFRENQDAFVMQVQNSRGGPRAFDYVPTTLALKLSDTKSSFGATDEYEPKTTVITNSP